MTKNDWQGLWAILWRVLIFVPILGILGLALLVLVIAAFVAPPIYSVFAFLTDDWICGIMALAVWVVVLRFRRPILRWTLEGIEHASL